MSLLRVWVQSLWGTKILQSVVRFPTTTPKSFLSVFTRKEYRLCNRKVHLQKRNENNSGCIQTKETKLPLNCREGVGGWGWGIAGGPESAQLEGAGSSGGCPQP